MKRPRPLFYLPIPPLVFAISLLASTCFAQPRPARRVRELALHNLHTNEDIDATYWRDGAYDPAGLAALDHFFRDYRTGAVTNIDPHLFDLLFRLRQTFHTAQPFDLISGYRSPATNDWLVTHTPGVSRHSMHMQGKAADIRLPGVPLAALRDVAKNLHAGGVGYYPVSDFVHVDTGRVRYW